MAVARKIGCKVEQINNNGDHVYTVVLKPYEQIPRFKSGQFLHLAIDSYDPSGFWPESRIFSIASSPSERDILVISYSVRGKYTARMERELSAGMDVWVKLPYGEFVIDGSRGIVLFAGGTGITAFTAFIDDLKPDFPNSIHLIYGARRKDLLLFNDIIKDRLASVQKFSVTYFIESEDIMPVQDQKDSRIEVIRGMISTEVIWPQINNPGESLFYISGPPVMLSSITESLAAKGIARDSIKIDAWE